jgi:hypothetical protein
MLQLQVMQRGLQAGDQWTTKHWDGLYGGKEEFRTFSIALLSAFLDILWDVTKEETRHNSCWDGFYDSFHEILGL